MAPKIPTIITTDAVNGGIPPMAWETSIATGVVIDLGANDKITCLGAPNNLAINTTEITPIMQPASCYIKMGSTCFFIRSNCWYNGTPNATTAGFKRNSINLAPSWYDL